MKEEPIEGILEKLGRVLKLLIGCQKCLFLRVILARFNKLRTLPFFERVDGLSHGYPFVILP